MQNNKSNQSEAHRIFKNEIDRGRITRALNCSVCNRTHPKGRSGNQTIHAHHDDYLKPLEVRWMCIQCHFKWHKENGSAKNKN